MTEDTIAARLARDPWQTPLGLTASAVWQAEEATTAMLASTDRHDTAPAALRALVRARRYCLEATPLMASQEDRELLAALVAACDEFLVKQGFEPVVRVAA